jgi:hypothetical protein
VNQILTRGQGLMDAEEGLHGRRPAVSFGPVFSPRPIAPALTKHVSAGLVMQTT